jgi:hypothetical protein
MAVRERAVGPSRRGDRHRARARHLSEATVTIDLDAMAKESAGHGAWHDMSCPHCKRARDVLLRAIEADRAEREKDACDVCGDAPSDKVWSEVEVCRGCYEGEKGARVILADALAEVVATHDAAVEQERKRIAAWLRAQGIIPGAFAGCIERGDHKR